MGGLKTLYNLLLKDAVKGSGQASGIMSIGDSVRKLAKKKFEAYVATAQKQGVDLDKLSEQELKYIIELNKPQKPKIISADSPEGKGITEALLGKRGQVIEGNFGKPFAKEIDLRQELAKAEARTKRISGNLRADNMQRTEIGKPKLDEDEYDYYREILDDEENNVVMGDETREMLEAMVKEQEAEMAYMKRLYDKGALDPKPGEKGRKKFLDRKAQKGDKMTPEEIEELKKLSEDPEDMATGGRVGLKAGMSKRAFLKLMGGAAAGIGALKAGALKMFGKEGARQVTKNVIKTDPVPGKPEWFDALVTKVINEGTDVTKTFATGERQSVYQKKLGKNTVVRVTQDIDDGAIRVEYESPDNVFGDTVQMEYKKPLPDEVNPNPKAEFTTAESGPVGRAQGPDDYDIEIDEVGGNSIKDLDSDLTRLKIYARGDDKPTLKEFVESKKRKDKAQRITEDPEAQSDAVVRRQGEMLDDDVSTDFASGGIARMLGE